jgi:DNA polymerase-3 subunit gamma/tau
VLVKHLADIAAKEGVAIDEAALALIARAAEGSVRDSLSLLDQAIAHAAGKVSDEDVRQMLGLADRVRVVDLFEALMKGDVAAALAELRAQYDIGADPAVVLSDLAEFTHFVTRVKVIPSVAEDVSLSEAERVRGRDFAVKLSHRVLSRTWQMLMKGIAEVQASGRPVAAAEMVLVRIAYAADLPTLDEAIKAIGNGSNAAVTTSSRVSGNGGAPASQSFTQMNPRASAQAAPRPSNEPMAQGAAAPTLALNSFSEIVALAAEKRDISTKLALERDVRLVHCEDGQLEIALEPSAAKTFVHDLQRKLAAWTGKRWIVVVSQQRGAPTLREQAEREREEVERGVAADPLVKAVLERFPGAKIVGVTQVAAEPDISETADPPQEEEDL